MSSNLETELQKSKGIYNKEIQNIKFVKNKRAEELKIIADSLKYVKKNSVVLLQQIPSKEQLYDELKGKFRMAWKAPGYCNSEFNNIPILKPKLLNTWQRTRCIEPQRNYKYPEGKGQKCRHQSEEFKDGPRTKLYPERFQKYLEERDKDYLEFKMRASKFQKIDYDLRLEKLIEDNKDPFKLVNTVQQRDFGFSKHSTWEKSVRQYGWYDPKQ